MNQIPRKLFHSSALSNWNTTYFFFECIYCNWSVSFLKHVNVSKQITVPLTNHKKFILKGYFLVPFLKKASVRLFQLVKKTPMGIAFTSHGERSDSEFSFVDEFSCFIYP